MAGLDSVVSGLNPIGMGLNVAGGIMNVIGAFGAKKEAKKQLDAQRVYSQQQRSAFDTGYGDLMSQAKGAATYQGDISRFTKAEQQAELAKRMASGMSRGAGEQIARDQAAQTSANALAAATRGAGSGTDIMTAALLSQQGENQAQNAISQRSAQEQMLMQNQAQQNQLSALGQTAAAAMRERGLEFSSLANKQANIMGVTQGRLEGEMNLNQNLFEGEQAKAAALAEADRAIYTGFGNIASGVGTSLMNMQAQDTQMSNLMKIYGNNAPGNQATMNKLGSFFTSGQFSPTGQAMFGAPKSPSTTTSAAPIQNYSNESPYSQGLLNATFGAVQAPKMPVYQGGFDTSMLPYLTRQ
jgi:hypothetical protein